MIKSINWGQALGVMFFLFCSVALSIGTVNMILHEAPDTLATVLGIVCSAMFVAVTIYTAFLTIREYKNVRKWRKPNPEKVSTGNKAGINMKAFVAVYLKDNLWENPPLEPNSESQFFKKQGENHRQINVIDVDGTLSVALFHGSKPFSLISGEYKYRWAGFNYRHLGTYPVNDVASATLPLVDYFIQT